jgi:hypothetical protein
MSLAWWVYALFLGSGGNFTYIYMHWVVFCCFSIVYMGFCLVLFFFGQVFLCMLSDLFSVVFV